MFLKLGTRTNLSNKLGRVLGVSKKVARSDLIVDYIEENTCKNCAYSGIYTVFFTLILKGHRIYGKS